RHVLGKGQRPQAALGRAQVDRPAEARLEPDGVAGAGGGDGLPQRQEVVIRGDLIRNRIDRQGGRGQAVLQGLDGQAAAGRGLADGAWRAGEQVADPGTSGHGKSPRRAGWSAVSCEDNEPGAQTGRPGAVGPVRGLLGGTTAPAALIYLAALAALTCSSS